MRWFAESLIAVAAMLSSAAITSQARAQACHDGTVDGQSIRWRTTMATSASLIGPLPDDVELDSIEGGRLRQLGERIVGVDVLSESGHVVLVTRQTISGDEITLH